MTKFSKHVLSLSFQFSSRDEGQTPERLIFLLYALHGALGKIWPSEISGILTQLAMQREHAEMRIEMRVSSLQLMFSNKDDPPSVKEARAIEKTYIRQWIQEARQKKAAQGQMVQEQRQEAQYTCHAQNCQLYPENQTNNSVKSSPAA